MDHNREKYASTPVTSFFQNNATDHRNMCLFFQKYNYCKYGNQCRYSHRKKFSPSQQFTHKEINENSENKKVIHDNLTAHSSNFSEEAECKTKVKIPCRYFFAGNCRNEMHCRFSHNIENHNMSSRKSNNFNGRKGGVITFNNSAHKKTVPLCRYFKQGYCNRGDNCNFYHCNEKNIFPEVEMLNNIPKIDSQDVNNTTISNSVDSFQNDLKLNVNSPTSSVRTILQRPSKNILELSSISINDRIQLRETEIKQLKTRFVKYEEVLKNEKFAVNFEPSDPDWPFDLRILKLEIYFPENYPTEICEIIVIRTSSNFPEILLNFLNRSIQDWLKEKFDAAENNGKVELIFRTFLKWFDKNLEELFTVGLRKVKRDMDAQKSGIVFVPSDQLFPSEKANTSESEDEIHDNEIRSQVSEIKPHSGEESCSNAPQKAPATKAKSNSTLSVHNALKQSVKIMFANLEFEEGIAALSCTKISMSLSCIRCKTICNLIGLPGRNQVHKCTKCTRPIECSFDPSVLHEFSGLLGTVYLLDCQIMDTNLVECRFLADCLNCSKQVPCEGLQYGQKQKFWCTFCSQKFIFTVGNVRFQSTRPINTSVQCGTSKKVDKRKDPIIKEGEPLPEYGTCKHYKKSFRWLRFPCCGRLYPCDICHDEKETDHEMKFASRMICGYCSKEQPYSKDKPCSTCSSNMIAKRAFHWEGGKGCRNRMKLDRRDKQKYSGVNKTISRKAAATDNGKNKNSK